MGRRRDSSTNECASEKSGNEPDPSADQCNQKCRHADVFAVDRWWSDWLVKSTRMIMRPLLFTAFITKPVDDVPGVNKNTAVRWQVDVIGKF